MLSIELIRQQPDFVKAGIASKNEGPEIVDEILLLDRQRRELLQEADALKHHRNEASERIAALKRDHQDATDAIAAMKDVGSQIGHLDELTKTVDGRLHDLLLRIPNLPHASVPVGRNENDNDVVFTWGDKRTFSFVPRPHWELGESLGIIDSAAGAKITGSRFYVLRGLGAKLERSLISWMLDVHVQEEGYTEILPPYLVNRDSMTGTGQLPKFAEDSYHTDTDDLFLDPTAEVPVTNLLRDEIIQEGRLPIKYVAYTACFRKEAGAAGKDTRGIIRVHQFNKVEMVKVVRPEESYHELDLLLDNAEGILRRLDLPYHRSRMCTGDLGFAAAMKYDPEVWMPGQDRYVEISSCSNFEDFQARRANIRYRTADGKLSFVHTLNGSGLAVGRTMAAILENYQEEDGTVRIPDVLVPYMGTDTIR
ncbi:MAG: serine--tRNA ligase [Caldisericota bacterium]|nr:serine--tRNA ligase [Caldisericota bacterium]